MVGVKPKASYFSLTETTLVETTHWKLVDPSRLELLTSAMSRQRSNQLSYGSKDWHPGVHPAAEDANFSTAPRVIQQLEKSFFTTCILPAIPAENRVKLPIDAPN